jgi:hypothetical protein
MLPFAMVPVTVALAAMARHWCTRALALALVATGVVVYSVSTAVFPHFPEKFGNPLYEVSWRLIADGLAPYNLGYALGLRGPASLVPVFIIVAAVLVGVGLAPGWRDRRHRLATSLGLAGAAAIVSAYRLFDGGGAAAERAYRWMTTVFPT